MPPLNSDDLACFACVANTGSFSRAALELGSDQSTVSRQIARLEVALEARLFSRSGRGVALTEAGRTLLGYAQQVAAAISEACDAVHICTAKGPSKLVIAAQPTIATTAFHKIGTAIKQRFPATKLRFVEGLAGSILGWLSTGEVDMALLYSSEQHSGLSQDVLLEEDLMLVTPVSWSYIGPTFPVGKLGEVPMILPSTEHGLRVLAESLASRAGATLNMAMECDASNTVSMRLVEGGCGATILPFAAVANRVAQGQLHAARLVEPVVTRKISLAMARNRPSMPELFEITQLVRKEVRGLVTSGSWIGTRLS